MNSVQSSFVKQTLYQLITYTPKSEYHGVVALYNMTPAPSATTFWHHFHIILKVLLPIFIMINTLIDITKVLKDSMKW